MSGFKETSALALGRRGVRGRRKGPSGRGRELFIQVAAVGAAAALGWASLASIDQVVTAPGKIVLTQKNQIVQHFEGGIIEDILVDEGDAVKKGDALVVVTDSRWIASSRRAELERRALRAKVVRLSAEATGLDRLSPPSDLAAAEVMAAERRIFDQRRNRLTASVAVLREQKARTELELESLLKRRALLEAERALVSEKADRLTQMAEKGAVSRNDQLTALIDLQKIDAQLSEMRFKAPQLEASVKEVGNQISVEILRFRSGAREELAETTLKLQKTDAEIRALADRAARAFVRSPVDGVVNTLYATTPGGVVREGQSIAEIVPKTQGLRVEVEVAPEDRARIAAGMPALVKVSAFDFGQFGGLKGAVESISADSVSDERGRSYFRVLVALESDEIGGEKVLPGMQVEVDVVGAPRSVLALLAKPVTRTLDRALK